MAKAALGLSELIALYKVQENTNNVGFTLTAPIISTGVGTWDPDKTAANIAASIDAAADWEITVADTKVPGQPVAVAQLKNPGDVKVADFGFYEKDNGYNGADDPVTQDNVLKIFASIDQDPQGSSAVAKLPNATNQALDSQETSSAIANAKEPAKKAAEKIAKGQVKPKLDDAGKKAIAKTSGKHDRARSSMEYHEWDYFIRKSDNWDLLHDAGVDGIQYTDSPTAVQTPGLNLGPPYWKWIRYREMRDLAECVKRFRRLRSACGGKALWTEQGFATKRAAIQDDIKNSTECQALITTLITDGAMTSA